MKAPFLRRHYPHQVTAVGKSALSALVIPRYRRTLRNRRVSSRVAYDYTMRKPIPLYYRMVRPYLVLVFAQIAVGAAAIFARFALTGAQPLAVSASRLTI